MSLGKWIVLALAGAFLLSACSTDPEVRPAAQFGPDAAADPTPTPEAEEPEPQAEPEAAPEPEVAPEPEPEPDPGEPEKSGEEPGEPEASAEEPGEPGEPGSFSYGGVDGMVAFAEIAGGQSRIRLQLTHQGGDSSIETAALFLEDGDGNRLPLERIDSEPTISLANGVLTVVDLVADVVDLETSAVVVDDGTATAVRVPLAGLGLAAVEEPEEPQVVTLADRQALVASIPRFPGAITIGPAGFDVLGVGTAQTDMQLIFVADAALIFTGRSAEATISEAGDEALFQILDAFAEFDIASMEIAGHIAAMDSDEGNNELSALLAQQVADFYTSALDGVVATSVGLGDEYPLVDDPANNLNNRIEIVATISE